MIARTYLARFAVLMFVFSLLCAATATRAEGKKWALLVGVEVYDSPDINHLDFAVKDVSAVASVLEKRLGYKVRLMTSDRSEAGDVNRPTNLNVFKTLDRLSEDIGPDDTFIFYFSGHGFSKEGQNFLGSVNTDPATVETLELSAIPLSTLQKKVQKLRAKQIIFIMDACRNDPEKGKGDGDNRLTDAFSKSLIVAAKGGDTPGAGSAILFACSEGERAFEDPARRQSAFTFYLLEALNGKAVKSGALTMNDVADYVQQQVAGWARDHNKKQTPELKTQGAARLVLADGVISGKAQGGKVHVEETEATLALTTDPPGAHIFVNGKDTGRTTPSTLTYEPASATENLTVRLERDGYKPVTLAVTLERGKETPVEQALKKLIAGGNGGAGGEGIAGATKVNPKDGAEMVFIPGGEFTMGSNDHEDEKPPHSVRLTKGYWMYRTVVTVSQYEKFCQDTGRQMPPEPVYANNHVNPGWKNKDHPIVNVSWNDAMAYCQWAGASLPTEAQWERAARGPRGLTYPWGNTFDSTKLGSSKSEFGDAGGTSAVGRFPASDFGLYDMAGNVWQWCLDCYDSKFYGSRSAKQTDPVNTVGDNINGRVLRGGSWNIIDEGYFRCSLRFKYTPTETNFNFGFRCVLQ